jgi:hypothetical protein
MCGRHSYWERQLSLSLAATLLLVIVDTVIGLLHAPAPLQADSLPSYSLQISVVLLFMAFDLAACLTSVALVHRMAYGNAGAIARSAALLVVLLLATSTTASSIAAQKYSCGDEHFCGIASGAFTWWDSAFNLTFLPLITSVLVFVVSLALFVGTSSRENVSS